MSGLEDKMLALTTMSSAQLRDAWRALKASPVPLISPSMLRLALGYELQGCCQSNANRSPHAAFRSLSRTA
jgi:hypothetical protein